MEQVIVSFTSKLLKITGTATTSVWKGFGSMASSHKHIKLAKKIGTHNGMFHCDEALACFLLKQLPEYEVADVVRSRDPVVLDQCEIVVDVGGEYDPKKNRFDHHQKTFQETLNSVRPDLTNGKFGTIRLSSAGLVYAHFGLEVITEVLKKNRFLATTECLSALYLHVYEVLIEELDAIDNGIPLFEEGKPRYRINSHLSARIHRLNPAWNDPNPDDTDSLFNKAMDLVGSEFTERVLEGFSSWWPAREIVRRTILARRDSYKTGEIILFEERCSWKDHLYAVEEELNICGEIKFCIFHDSAGDSWRVQAIPVQPDSFICRVFLHKDWRGVRDDELSQIAGIENCIFCHGTGFIGGNKTKKGALEMAVKSLKALQVNRE